MIGKWRKCLIYKGERHLVFTEKTSYSIAKYHKTVIQSGKKSGKSEW